MQFTGATYVVIALVFVLVLVTIAIVISMRRSRAPGNDAEVTARQAKIRPQYGSLPSNIGADDDGIASVNPYLDPTLIEYSLLDRQIRTTQSWRRAFFLSVIVVILSVGVSFVLATKDHTDALIYKEDSSGDIALMGLAGTRARPTENSVKNALAAWIKDARTIPGDDPDLVQQNFLGLMSMTANSSDAQRALQSRVVSENPLSLGKRGYRRTVLRVEVNQLSDLTYRIAWNEAVRQGSGSGVARDYSGTVTLAQRPSSPTDPLIGQLNPSGVFVNSFDIAWSTITP